MMRRTSLDVAVDILDAALEGANKTHLVYRANLNFAIIKSYLNTLIGSGMLSINEKGKYMTTSKGAKFVEDYRNLLKPLNL